MVGTGDSAFQNGPPYPASRFSRERVDYEDGGNSSEHQFQAKLNLARSRGCARDLARRGADRVARKDERVRKIKVRPVSDVKKFGAKQHPRPFRVVPLVNATDLHRSLKVWICVGAVWTKLVAIAGPIRSDQWCKREATEERRDAVHLPAADQLVRHAVQPVQEALAAAEGQLVTEVSASLMAEVEG